MQTKAYRAQHETLRKLCNDLQVSAPDANEPDLRQQLVKLAGTLKAHLTMEDKFLYPAMLAHADAKIRDLATKYQSEMGGLAAAFEAFITTWGRIGAIDGARSSFVKEWTGVREAVFERMNREDNELYNLVDRYVQLEPVKAPV